MSGIHTPFDVILPDVNGGSENLIWCPAITHVFVLHWFGLPDEFRGVVTWFHVKSSESAEGSEKSKNDFGNVKALQHQGLASVGLVCILMERRLLGSNRLCSLF